MVLGCDHQDTLSAGFAPLDEPPLIRAAVFRPMLVQRLTRLEKRLKVPLEERHVCEGSLQTATEVNVEGVRVRHRAGLTMTEINVTIGQVEFGVTEEVDGQMHAPRPSGKMPGKF